MVYIKYPNFNVGAKAQYLNTFIGKKTFTPQQKMELARNRIWGNEIGDHRMGGMKKMKKPLIGPRANQYYGFHDLNMIYPGIKDHSIAERKKEKFFERRNRIFMRGIKIGNRKQGGGATKGMAVFEMKDSKKGGLDDLEPVGAAEEQYRASLSDESLGLTSSDPEHK